MENNYSKRYNTPKKRDKYLDYLRIWRKKNKQYIRDHFKKLRDMGYFKEWDRKNRDKRLKSERKYNLTHKKKVYEKVMRKYNRLKSIPGLHSKQEWEDKKKEYENKCAVCRKRKKLTKDHIIPIHEKDSTNYIDNIQPLCINCNSEKGTKVVLLDINSNKKMPQKKQRISGMQKKGTSPNKKNSKTSTVPQLKKTGTKGKR